MAGRPSEIEKEIDSIAKEIFGVGFIGKTVMDGEISMVDLRKAMLLSYQAGLSNGMQKVLDAYRKSVK